MIRRWIIGSLIGTMLVWVTSPLFVRSYHSKVYDPVCQNWVYPAGTTYRWRSEGYATTAMGPHGMPGRETVPRQSTNPVIALWGDSQAEGVCVPDDDKLWRVLQARLSAGGANPVEVLPLAHSGENAANWTRGFSESEQQLGVTAHILLICELDDLMPLAHPVANATPQGLSVRGDRMLDAAPDFVIDALRALILQRDSLALRRLRFGVGPIESAPQRPSDQPPRNQHIPAAAIATRLARSTTRPITMLYAPRVPRIVGGEILGEDPQNAAFEPLALEMSRHGVHVVDCRDELKRSVDHGVFPHGFQNGVIGNGHLNAAGYRAIANAAQLAEVR
ncbi:hypothetical protein [Allorhodopirellula heiligendammensis]|uniref:SGNH hydrolase-type esterase domain-containing protein n=1 Tax=Allorhodopirellula heiligendammensis TaxID=2714739 RepID=A0A5C6BG86_9BACT|nr:hypothetical protein [Allorhodopirellula heiligendammensis]TWU10647.1 hypothetical protein Poly21_45530 [Allorhodopirellula heiligendammensis]